MINKYYDTEKYKQTAAADKKQYDKRHGGPYDRGSADAYYHRPPNPHYYVGNSYSSERVEDLTEEELEAYKKGYDEQIESGDFKQW
jgi:hypothetical protein